MAKYIDIVCSIEYFINYIHDLLSKYGISVYIEKYETNSNLYYFCKIIGLYKYDF